MESINLIKNMDKVHLLGQVEILIMERITEMIETDKELWNGLMEVFMRENGLKEFSMVTEKWLMQTVKKLKESSKITSSFHNNQITIINKISIKCQMKMKSQNQSFQW